MSRRAARSTKPTQDTQLNAPSVLATKVIQEHEEGITEDIPLRRSARIAAKTTNDQTTKQDDASFLRTRSKPKVKPDLSSNSQSVRCSDKENVPVPKVDNISLPHLDSLSLTCKTDKQCVEESVKPTTPVKKFHAREGIIRSIPRTPLSGFNKRRNSASPHPHNFLRKVEDPLVQRIVSPLPPQKTTEDSKSAIYFNHIVEKEEIKFRQSCTIWNKVLEAGSAPERVHGQILSAIGQANLFQNKRFKQFKELIELHKDKNAEKKATEADLAGFWEMIYYQVEDVHKRFSALEELKSRDWEEEKPESKEPVKPAVLKVKTKQPVKNLKKPAVSSKFKLFRQQMLEKKASEKANDDILIL